MDGHNLTLQVKDWETLLVQEFAVTAGRYRLSLNSSGKAYALVPDKEK